MDLNRFRTGQVHIFIGPLCLGHGWLTPEDREFAARILEAVDLFEANRFDLAAGLQVAVQDRFCLRRCDEIVDLGSVVATGFPADRPLSLCLRSGV